MRRTDTTLLEQMRINDEEINTRMKLLDLDEASLTLIANQKHLIETNIDLIVEEFYQRQTSVEEISLLIGDADTLQRLTNAQRRYVLDLFSGIYDGEYVNNRLRIGLVHKRIGVEPKLYLSAVKTLKGLIVSILRDNIKDQDLLYDTVTALNGLIFFDTTLVFDTYIDSLVGEIESAKRKTEAYAKSLEAKVQQRTKQLEAQAKIDPLTGISNQRSMQEGLRREMSSAKRRGTELSLVYFDVDKFKLVNDQQGHIKGDEMLKHIGQAMKESVREVDICCRYGGDEFCLILPECKLIDAARICQYIIDRYEKRYPDSSLSMGIASLKPDDQFDDEQLIRLADEQMYLAKACEGSKICY